jgi:MFS family permease
VDVALRRLLALVSAIVLVDVMFYSAIAPLLPAYVEDLGLSKSQAGVLAGSYALGTLVAAVPAGVVAARWGARRTLLAGLVVLVVSCLAFGFARRYDLLVGARLLQGLGGAAAWAAGLAWLISVAPPGRRGQLIGIALGMAIVGAMCGPVIGAAATFVGTEIVFSAVAAVAAGLTAAVFVRPAPDATPPAAAGVRPALRARRVLAGAWLTALPALFYGTLSVLAPLRLDELGLGAAGVGAVFLAAASLEALASPIVGGVSDRRGRLLPLRTGLLGVGLAALLLPAADAALVLGALVVVAGLSIGMLWAPAAALISDGAEDAGVSQGVAFGLVNLAWAGGQVGGTTGGAGLADLVGDAAPYALLAALAAVTLAALSGARS